MALEAGVMAITLEYAQGLKDKDWFGKQDPYCVVKCGTQQFRTKTATDGGKNPVWNETFSFNVINENSIECEIKDEDVGGDDRLGFVTFSLAKAREQGHDRLQAPVIRKNSKKQQGFVSVAIKWTPNRSLQQGHPPGGHPPQGHYAQPQYYAPPPGTYYPPAQQAFYAPPPGPYAGQPYPGQPYPPPGAQPYAYPPPGAQPYPPPGAQPYPPPGAQPYPPPGAQPYPPPGAQPYPYPQQGYPPR